MKAEIVITFLCHPPRFRGSSDPDWWIKAGSTGNWVAGKGSVVTFDWIRFWHWKDASREISRRVSL